MPKENKVTKAEKAQRVNKVYELMVSGATRYQIHQYAASTSEKKANWNLSERQIDNYMAAAAALITTEAEYQRPKELGRAIASLNDLYQRCMKVQDYQRALAVRRELNQLLGLHAPPPAQTLKIMGVDQDVLITLLEALQQHDLRASDVFNAMLAELEAKGNGR